MASYLTTPKKPLSDVCRVCGSPFSKDKKNKVSLFRGTAGLHTALQEATGRSVAEDDGLPPYVCTTCRNKLLKFLRLQRQLQNLGGRDEPPDGPNLQVQTDAPSISWITISPAS